MGDQLTISNQIVRALEDVLKVARMDNCCFDLPDGDLPPREEWDQWPFRSDRYSNNDDTDRIRLATLLWRKSWLIGPLERAIRDIKGHRSYRVKVPEATTFYVDAESTEKATAAALAKLSDILKITEVA